MEKIKQFISVSLMLSDNQSYNIEMINDVMSQMSESVIAGEVILIVNSRHDEQFYLSTEKINDIPDNLSVKIVRTNKLSKEYVLHNLGWQSAIGDIICHVDLSLTQDNVDVVKTLFSYMKKSTEHLAFLTNDLKVHRLYKQVNDAYKRELLDETTCGYIATRQAINTAFNTQDDTYDPYISLAISGLTSVDVDLIHTANKQVDASKKYSADDEHDLLLQYTRTAALDHLEEEAAPMHAVIFYSLSLLLMSFQPLLGLLSLLVSTLAILAANRYYAIIYANYLLSKQMLAAANEKNVVGQLIITNRQDKSID